jgi:hypothetical protein
VAAGQIAAKVAADISRIVLLIQKAVNADCSRSLRLYGHADTSDFSFTETRKPSESGDRPTHF